MADKRKDRLAVTVIGAGAVGLYLAWRLSQKGHYVVVYEKRLGIKAKACSGLVSESIERYVPGLISLAENRIDSCFIHFPRKTIRLNFCSPHFVVCRQKINERLFELAKHSGASFVWLSTFDRIKDRINRFDRIIGCDGAHSEVRKFLDIADPEMKLGIQAFRIEKDHSAHVDVWPIQGGFFWRIPRGNNVEYGLVGDKNTSARQDVFLRLAKNFCGVDLSCADSAASIPQGLVLPQHPKITLCGDAAGLTKPWSRGGLLWGFHAADILVESFPDFDEYVRKAKRVFRPQIYVGKKVAALVRWTGNNLPFLIPSGIISKIGYDNDFMPILPR